MNTESNLESNIKSLFNVAVEQEQLGNLEIAANYYQKILKLKPDSAGVYYNLGNLFKQQGKMDEAVKAYQKALQLKPAYTKAHINLGNLFQQQGKLLSAISSYEEALKNEPNSAITYYNLGTVLAKTGNLPAAVESYEKALKQKPDYAEAYCNLGIVLKKQGKFSDAVKSYQQALKQKPEFIEVHCNLGNVLKEQGKLEAAVEAYQEALKIQPDLDLAKFCICITQLPIIYKNFAEIEIRRKNYQHHLQNLAQHYKQATSQELKRAADVVGTSQPFFLAYQGLNDRNLQQIYGDMIVHIMSNCYPQWSQDIPLPDLQPNEKIRIGFVSGYFYKHSVWKIPMKGWVENLDRSQFELFGYYTNTNLKQDEETVKAAKAFDKFAQGPLPLEKWAEAIQKDKLHALIFPEFGMDPTTVQLGCLKLAPTQIVFGGHPETSGLPTIDYHLSSDLMEPENAQEHYTEQLIRLPNMAVHYTHLDIPPKPVSKADIGIAEDDIMFWSCQSLYKYLPQNDDVFPRIARDVDKCKFVFIQNDGQFITEIFQQRLKQAFEEFGLNYQDYCVFLPRLKAGRFAGVTAIADIFLDNIGWSGNNTTMESTAFNVPIVTYPGEMMRGRHVMAILKMMGIEETIASSKEEYVQIAIRLGKDVEYRQHISNLIAQNKHKLYNDLKPVRALEEFLFDVVGKQRVSTADNITDTLRLAIKEHRANHLESAQQTYQQVLAMQSNHPEALYGLAMMAQQKGELQQAEELFSWAAQGQPDSVKIWFALGNLYQLQEELPAAEDAYKKAIALRPDAASIHNNLGYTLQQQGKWSQAIICYQKAVKIQPNCIEADINLGNALHAQSKLSSDKKVYYAKLNHKLGLMRKKVGDLVTAEAYLKKALELNPDYKEVRMCLADIHEIQPQKVLT
ncbi:MAG: tetratricopeptide repeat protein [Calothrix sp. MO_167.B42]|nr:tetratricopeptide repeat protein [Calothrix sp. MO_167.B42]